jgi:hypothetical protein
MATRDDSPTTDPKVFLEQVAAPVARRLSARTASNRGSGSAEPETPQAAAANNGSTGQGRERVHGALDGALDTAEWFLRTVGRVASHIVETVRDTIDPSHAAGTSAGIVVLGIVRPGQTATAEMVLTNAIDQDYDDLRVVCSAFVSSSGDRISEHRSTVSPVAVRVPAGGSTPITLKVEVPARTRRGSYLAVIDIVGRPEVRTLATLDVE